MDYLREFDAAQFDDDDPAAPAAEQKEAATA